MRVPGSLSSAFLAFVRSRRVLFRVGDLLHVVVEVEGYRREDAREKKATMGTCWVPAGNTLRPLGRWAFAELTEIYQIESDFKAKVESAFDEMIARAGGVPPALFA